MLSSSKLDRWKTLCGGVNTQTFVRFSWAYPICLEAPTRSLLVIMFVYEQESANKNKTPRKAFWKITNFQAIPTAINCGISLGFWTCNETEWIRSFFFQLEKWRSCHNGKVNTMKTKRKKVRERKRNGGSEVIKDYLRGEIDVRTQQFLSEVWIVE